MKGEPHEKIHTGPPTREPAPEPGETPAPSDESPASGWRYLFWLLALLVWVGAFLFLWGAEMVGLIYRAIAGNPG